MGTLKWQARGRFSKFLVTLSGWSFREAEGWIGLFVAVAFIGVIALRIRDEEAFMRQEFGSEWEAYCQRSWRLIPFLY